MAQNNRNRPVPLRLSRQAEGLSLRELSEATDIPYSALQKLETGGLVRDHQHAVTLWRFFQGKARPASLLDIYCPHFAMFMAELDEEAADGMD